MTLQFEALPKTKQREIEFLLCCARTQMGLETRERIRRLGQIPLDWEYIVSTALHHRVMPLLYRSIHNVCPESVPNIILERLRKYFLANAARNVLQTAQLLKLLDLLEDQGVVAVPFKGPALAEAVYGDVALRQFCDLDILVSRRNAPMAYDLLMSQGFQPEVRLSSKQIGAYLQKEYSFTSFSNNGKVIVDIHWEMTGRYTACPFDLQLSEDRLEYVTLNGKRIRQLSAEDLLVYLCLHGTKDCWSCLNAVCSLAELIRSHPKMDWVYVKRLARKMRCQRMLSLGLLLAHGLVGASLPTSVLEVAKADSAIRGVATKTCKTLFREHMGNGQKLVSSDFSSYHLKVRDRLSDGVRYGVALAFRPSRQEWKSFPLPPDFSFLRYLLRPMRLTVELGLNLIHRKQNGTSVLSV